MDHREKNVRIRSYSGPYFPAFGLNNSEYGHFSCSGKYGELNQIETQLTLCDIVFILVFNEVFLLA